MVEINGAAFNAFAPCGGVKQSGYGRELGHLGLEEYQTVRAIRTQLVSGAARHWSASAVCAPAASAIAARRRSCVSCSERPVSSWMRRRR